MLVFVTDCQMTMPFAKNEQNLHWKNENVVSRMWDTERQLVLARRGEAEMEVSLKNTNRDTAQYVLKIRA